VVDSRKKKVLNRVLVVLFILLFISQAVNIVFHATVGIALVVLVVVHGCFGSKWLKGSTKVLLRKKIKAKTLISYLLVVGLSLVLLLAILTGIILLVNLGLYGETPFPLHRLHTIGAIISAVLVVAHILRQLLLKKSLGKRELKR